MLCNINLYLESLVLFLSEFEKARGYKIERENYVANLLGILPPPPDLGKDTKLKPIKDVHGYDDRSHFKNATETIQGRFNRSNKKQSSRSSTKRESDVLQYNWRTERRDYASTSSKRDRRDSETSYDFKFDY